MNAILIVQPNKQEAHGLLTILKQRYGDDTVITLAYSCEEASEVFNQQKPDLIIIDLAMINGQKSKLISNFVKNSPGSTCVALANEDEHEDIFLALKAGAKGYLYKETSDEQLIKHLDLIIENRPDVSPAVAYQMIGYFHKRPMLLQETILSERECEILKLIARGKKRAEIAELLNISVNTVATHTKSIYNKLEINSRSEATREAIQRGLI